MPARISYEKAVCPSVRLCVCLSVKRVICDKTEESCVQIVIPYERPFSLVLWEEEWFVRGQPFLPQILGQTDPVGAKTLIFKRYSLVAPHR